MKRPEEIGEDHIYRLAKGFHGLGIDLDPNNNVNHYVALRKILETCVNYYNEVKKDPKLASCKEKLSVSEMVDEIVA